MTLSFGAIFACMRAFQMWGHSKMRIRQGTIATAAALAASMLSSFVGGAAHAYTVFTDRAAWEVAAGATVNENWSSFSLGQTFPAPFSTSTGIAVTPSGNPDISNFAFSSIGQGQAFRLRGNISFTLTGLGASAFGFDYEDHDFGGNTVSVDGTVFALALTGDADAGITPDDFAFFGVIAGPGEAPLTTAFIGVSDFMSIDNVAYASGATEVAEPMSLAAIGVGLTGLALARRRRPA